MLHRLFYQNKIGGLYGNYKLNSPLLVNGQQVYPKTSADQVTFKDCPPSSLQDMFNLIYPVGSIYMSVNDTNPHELFGDTWEQINGRFLVGVGELDDNTTNYWGTLTEKYNMPLGEKGGQVKHTLTIDEMPKHRHEFYRPNGNMGTAIVDMALSQQSWGLHWENANAYYANNAPMLETGGNKSHNNIPPYYAVYMWQRTA